MPIETTDTKTDIFDAMFEGSTFPCLAYKDFLEKEHNIVASDRTYGVLVAKPQGWSAGSRAKETYYPASSSHHSYKLPQTWYRLHTNPERLRPLSDRIYLGAVLGAVMIDQTIFGVVYDDLLNPEDSLMANPGDIPNQLDLLGSFDNAKEGIKPFTEALKQYKLSIRQRIIFSDKLVDEADKRVGSSLPPAFTICFEFGEFDDAGEAVIKKRFLINPMYISNSGAKCINRLIMRMLQEQPTMNTNIPLVASVHMEKLYEKGQL